MLHLPFVREAPSEPAWKFEVLPPTCNTSAGDVRQQASKNRSF
jgi:hypothetical protein